MSGTSADGIDAVVVSIEEPQGLRLLASHHERFDEDLRRRIQSLMRPDSNELERAALAGNILGEQFARAANAALDASGLSRNQIRAIGSHGQTLRHNPQAEPPYTVQIGNPAIIAERTGIATVADFRSRDMAAGGQGAPLVPGFHRWVFWQPGVRRIIVNIGGIANLTILPADPHAPVFGFDTGPGNTLLDHWISRHRGERFDADGDWAAAGKLDQALLAHLLEDPFFTRPPPKSTGVEYFSAAWLGSRIAECPHACSPGDVQTTVTELTACTIARAISGPGGGADEVYVCGGGAHNKALVHRLQASLGSIPLRSTAELGLHPDWVEAAAFAWLAHRTTEGLTGNLPAVTGASHEVVLGAIYPG